MPQQFCNDITGNWIVSGTGGVGAEWDLVQTGTGVQGTSYVSTPSCGVVGSPITGYLSGNTFSLNFTSNSSCTAPAASASVSLTSNSCSVASGQVTPGVGGITLQPKRSTNNPVPTPNPPTAHYNITYAAYIPVDNILGPRPCPYFTPGQQLPVPWLPLYKGDANRGTYRAAQSVVVIPDAARDYNFYYNTGATRNFGFGSPANGSNANLDSYPLTSDIYFGPYGGADEDTVDLDCYKWNNAGHAPTAGMQVDSVSYPSPTQAQAHLYGSATNPLEPSPPITWDMNVVVDDSNPASPTAYVNYNHTCYPAHIVKVNGTVVYSYQPAYNNPFYLGNCLLQSPLFGKVVGQSSAVIVPLQ